MHLADELPDFAAETFALHGFQPFEEALADTIYAQVLNLEAQIRLNPILRLQFLDRLQENGDPLILSVCLWDVKFVDRLKLGLLSFFLLLDQQTLLHT